MTLFLYNPTMSDIFLTGLF